MELTWLEALGKAIFSEAGLVAVLLFASTVYMGYREHQQRRRAETLMDKLVELNVNSIAALERHSAALELLKDRIPR